jgi:glycosyltransferase involved in cell wall biosynthesis
LHNKYRGPTNKSTAILRIAVNTRLLRPHKLDGIGWFTFNTLQHLVQHYKEVEFHCFFDGKPDASFLLGPNMVAHVLLPPARHAVLNVVWFQWQVKRYLKRVQPDLFLSPDGNLCLGWQGPQLAVIHDINFLHQPQALKFSNRHYYNYFYPRFARKATRIATVSEFSKQDICTHYGIAEDKVDVVYNGVNSFFQPLKPAEQQQVRQQYTTGKPYFLFVGTLSPRKNVDGLMRAYDRFCEITGSTTQLLIAGGTMYRSDALYALQRQLKHGSSIHFTGRLPDAELNRVLGAARALTFVPHFEGFGIPLIEAMQCDVPVVASNVTSLPEVTGDAALLVPPNDTDAITQALIQLDTDAALRQRLIEKGRIRKTLFSWEKTARLLWNSMERCL